MDTYKSVEELTIGTADQSKQFRALMFTSTQDVDARLKLGIADGSLAGVTLDFHFKSVLAMYKTQKMVFESLY